MSTATSGVTSAAAAAYRQTRTAVMTPGRDRIWMACAIAAAVLIAVAAFMPLWQMTLKAPQYPQGLHLTAYGTSMEGDLREINALNHYVGIKAIEPHSVTELKLFPYAMGTLVLGLLAGAAWQVRPLRWLLPLAVWAAPAGMLLDMQWWLHQYGHDLDPTAAFRLEPFTPKVIGTTKVMNFHTDTMVTSGFWLMVAAGLVITVGPWAVRFARDSWRNTGTAAAVGVMALTLGLLLARPAEANAAAGEGTSIAALIEAAAPGATVVVPAGTYVEHITIDRPLVLEASGTVILDGGGVGDVVRITADDVTLRGFEIRHSGRTVVDEPAGIRVLGHRAAIEDNVLSDVLYGVILDSSDGHLVRGNRISSVTELPAERRGHALYVYDSRGSTLTGNVVDYAKDGVFLGFASGTTVEGNAISHVRYGLHTMYSDGLTLRSNVLTNNVAGASLMYSQGILVEDNEFSENRSAASGYGLLFKDVDDVDLVGNRIHHNRLGLTMDGAPRTPGHHVTLRGNLISYNQVALELFTTASATFVDNTFSGNLQQVESRGGDLSGKNTWSVDGRGNYWDDYRGFDADGDGVGELPYRYEGGYDGLVRRDAALRLYAYTPAQAALDLAMEWFPVYREEPRVVDAHPLLAPTIALPLTGSSDVAGAVVSAALVAAATLALLAFRRGGPKAWA